MVILVSRRLRWKLLVSLVGVGIVSTAGVLWQLRQSPRGDSRDGTSAVGVPADASAAVSAMSDPRRAHEFLAAETRAVVPAGAQLVAPGSTVRADDGSWSRIGAVGWATAMLHRADGTAVRLLVVFALEEGRWRVSSTEPLPAASP